MGDLSEHFNRKEFACKCGCGFDFVDAELVKVLQELRSAVNKPITITSACRCEKHNKKVGGSNNSKHKLGIAADIVVEGVSALDVYNHLATKYKSKYGLGRYDEFTHIDARQDKARW